MNKGVRMLISVLVGGAVAYFALVVFVYVIQGRLIYFPDRNVYTTPQARGLAFESVRLHTDDGVELDAWFVPAERRRGVLLFCHGNAGNISHRLESLAVFHELGLSTLIFDYRGYGRSTGASSEEGTYRDAAAAWLYLVKDRGVPPDQIVLFGRSLGAAVATWLATQHKPAALIVESGFTSVPALAAEVYPWLPVHWLARFRYNNLDRIAQLDVPVLVVHSREDEIIPYLHGRRLFDAARGRKQLLEIRGGHNDGFLVSGTEYSNGLDRFLSEVLGKPRPIQN